LVSLDPATTTDLQTTEIAPIAIIASVSTSSPDQGNLSGPVPNLLTSVSSASEADGNDLVIQAESTGPNPGPSLSGQSLLVHHFLLEPSGLPGTLGSFAIPPNVYDLPDQPFVTVVGQLTPGQTVNIYHIPNDGQTSRIGFVLHALPPSLRPPDERLTVMDESGETIGEADPLPGSMTVSLNVPVPRSSEDGSGFFVEVSSSNASMGMVPSSWLRSDSYLLQIIRQGPTINRGAWGSGASPTANGQPSSLQVLEPSLASLSSASNEEGGVSIVNQGEPTDVIEGPVPTGPLPARSAAPLGGVLGDGDPVPQVDRRDAVAVDLELIGIPVGEPDVAVAALDAAAAEAAIESTIEPAGRLTAVRGPGGFPLLASASGETPPRPLAKLPALPRRWASPSVVSLEPRPVLLPTEPETAPTRAQANLQAPPSLRSSIGSGLAIALTLVFGLVRSDLVAVFERKEPPEDRSGPVPDGDDEE
jgi:hypothetical protein